MTTSRNNPAFLGRATESAKYRGVYRITERAEPGREYVIECPCCTERFNTRAEGEQLMKVRCPKCNTLICYSSKPQKPVPAAQASQPEQQKTSIVRYYDPMSSNRSPAQLSWPGQKPIDLEPRTYIIGRDDPDDPSDIRIADNAVSRRSLKLEVTQDPIKENYKFLLTLLKTTNPVFLDEEELVEGDSIYLRYGDTISIGQTTLLFKEKKR